MSRVQPKDHVLREAYEQARALAEIRTEERRRIALRYAGAGHHGRKAICTLAHVDFNTLTRWIIEAGQCLDTKSEERCGKCVGCRAKETSVAHEKVTE